MKFQCETAELKKATKTVIAAVAAKHSTPIFGAIHLIARSDGTLRLEGMDVTLSMSCEIKGSVEEEGEILIEAQRFNKLVNSLNSDTVSFSKEETQNNVHMTAGSGSYNILLMGSLDDYPKFPDFNADKSFTLEEEKIKELIDKTEFACSKDEARPLFNGVLCEIQDGKITFVGTNTHRLVIKTLPLEGTDNMSIIIPSKVLREILTSLNAKLPQEVQFSLASNQLMVVIGNVTIVSRLIEGRFPDYRRVVPPTFAVKTKVATKAFAGAVSRMSLCSGSESDYSIVKISIEGNEMKVMSSSPEVGTGEEMLPCQTEGEGIHVAFNAAYVTDILKHIATEETELSLNNSLSPVCIRPTDAEEYTYIVTPVRVVF